MLKIYGLVFFMLITISSICKADEKFDSAQQFWLKFRQTVLDKDYEKLKKNTKFPFPVHGEVDFIPVKQISKENFIPMFKKILEQVEVDYDMRTGETTETTVLKVIQNTPKLDQKLDMSDNFFRVSNLSFQYANGEWKLVRGYLIEE